MSNNHWQVGILSEWSICGMNHYHINGEKFLFVSMVKGDTCIIEEGSDNKDLWDSLTLKAKALTSS